MNNNEIMFCAFGQVQYEIFSIKRVFSTISCITLMCTQRGIIFLWRFKLTRSKKNHMYLSYLKILTKIELCSENILSFHTLNEHILLVKRVSDKYQTLEK